MTPGEIVFLAAFAFAVLLGVLIPRIIADRRATTCTFKLTLRTETRAQLIEAVRDFLAELES